MAQSATPTQAKRRSREANHKTLYKPAPRRKSALMIDKMTWLEILPEVVGLLDSLKAEEQRQIMAALAERYGLKVSEKSSGGRGSYRPTPKRKTRP
jgi:hypothetical protein